METTHFTEKNYMTFFELHREKMNLMPVIRDWIEEKKKTLPSWNQYCYDEEGNIFHRFMLDDDPEWTVLEKDLKDLGQYQSIKAKIKPTKKEIKEAVKEAWLSREE